MSNETVRIVLAVDVAQLDQGSRKAVAALGQVEAKAKSVGTTSATASEKAAEAARKHEAAANKVGNSLMLAGTAAVGAAVLATKSASDWESAYAGVRKTVDGSVQEMKHLEAQLRGIAKVTPATHREIAAVAEAAGQLGVARDDVAKFTKTMIDLGVTTNITAEQGAMSIRQFMNIMGSAADDVDRIASAIVGLGNKSATTENDIMNMAQRLAGVGKQMRMSEAEVLGMAAAMASVGIEAEAGGTAMSLTMTKIDGLVRAGGPKLALLGDLADMTGEQFAQAWGKNAAQATAHLIEGLGTLAAEGKDVSAALYDIGIKGVRQTDTLKRLSGATKAMGGEVNLLAHSLKIGSEEFERNNALQNEAAQRYGTTAEKAKIAANQINDNLITMGNALLPIANQGIQVISDLAAAFGALPEPIQGGITGAIGLAGVVALAAGGAIKATIAFKSAQAALAGMGTSMRNVSLKGGAVGLGLTALALIVGHFAGKAAQARQDQDDWASALRNTNGEIRNQNGLVHENIRTMAAKKAEEAGLLEMAQRSNVDMRLVTDAIVGEKGARERLVAAMEAQRNKLKEQLDGTQQATAAWHDLENQYLRADEDARLLAEGVDQINGVMSEQADNARRVADATKESTDATDKDAKATAENARQKQAQAEATQRAKDELYELIDATFAAVDANLKLLGDELAIEKALLDAGDAAKEWGKKVKAGSVKASEGLDITTRAGQENLTAILEISKASNIRLKEMVKEGRSVDDIRAQYDRYSAAVYDLTLKFGGNKEKAAELVAQYLQFPEEVSTIAELESAGAKKSAEDWARILNAFPDEQTTELRAALNRGDKAAAEAAFRELTKPRTAVINIATRTTGGGAHGTYASMKAAGGIVKTYAAGGFGDVANAHRPELVPAGTWRVWAEPETKGEAYIPLANDWRRPRAQAILRETAQIIGVKTFAGGGIEYPRTPPPTPPAALNIGPLHINATGVSAAEVAREITSELRREVRAQGLGVN